MDMDDGDANDSDSNDDEGELPLPQLIDEDPTLFANLKHLRKNDPTRALHVGPKTGRKGYRQWFPVDRDHFQQNIARSYSSFGPNNDEDGFDHPSVKWTDDERAYNAAHPTIALKYFLKFFPAKLWNSMVEGTNHRLSSRKYTPSVTKTEIMRFLGIQITRVLERRRGPFDDLFERNLRDGGVLQGGDYTARFGVEKGTYKNIADHFRLRVPHQDDDVDEDEGVLLAHYDSDDDTMDAAAGDDIDPWYQVRELVEEFNLTMPKAFKPGKFIVVDEIMSAWKGLSGQYALDGIPHQQKIKRKPEGVGAEMKAASCGVTRILLQLDIMEGAEAMASKPYYNEYGAGCSVVLRLLTPWKYKNKVVIADSAFSSLLTLIALWCLFGTFFMGIVKTAHTHFPLDVLRQWFNRTEAERDRNDNRGEWAVFTTTFKNRISPRDPLRADRNFSVMAVCWADRKPKCIISNWSNSRRCDSDIIRERSIVEKDRHGISRLVSCDKTVMQPNVINEFYKYFSAIDINDHSRQGILAIERYWLTKRWWLRVFQTVLGVIILSAYQAYCLEGNEKRSFLNFVSHLAKELIFYSEDRASRHCNSEAATSSDTVCTLIPTCPRK